MTCQLREDSFAHGWGEHFMMHGHCSAAVHGAKVSRRAKVVLRARVSRGCHAGAMMLSVAAAAGGHARILTSRKREQRRGIRQANDGEQQDCEQAPQSASIEAPMHGSRQEERVLLGVPPLCIPPCPSQNATRLKARYKAKAGRQASSPGFIVSGKLYADRAVLNRSLSPSESTITWSPCNTSPFRIWIAKGS